MLTIGKQVMSKEDACNTDQLLLLLLLRMLKLTKEYKKNIWVHPLLCNICKENAVMFLIANEYNVTSVATS